MEKIKKALIRATLIFIVGELLILSLVDSSAWKWVLSLVLLAFLVSKVLRAVRKKFVIQFSLTPKGRRPSATVTRYLENLHGIEIGGSTQNSYQLKRAINVDFADDPGVWQDTRFEPATVHLVANGDDLPFKDNTLDYVLSSHNIEHYFDPVQALKEWWRVIKPGGYIVVIVPHKDRTFDRDRDETALEELMARHRGEIVVEDYVFKRNQLIFSEDEMECETSATGHQLCRREEPVPEGWTRYEEDDHHHWSVWRTDNFLGLCRHLEMPVIEYQDKDDKVGNGFTIIIQKPAVAAADTESASAQQRVTA